MTTLGELAKVLELELRGDPARAIASLAALESATAGVLSFVSEKNIFTRFPIPTRAHSSCTLTGSRHGLVVHY